MKKHFLLLLMAFFSLAGWAQTYDLSDVTAGEWTIDFVANTTYADDVAFAKATAITTNPYTGAKVTPIARLKQGSTVLKGGRDFNVAWSPSEPLNVLTDGYTATITSDMTHTFGTLKNATKKFYVLKTSSDFTTAPNLVTGPLFYTGKAQNLITNDPEAYAEGAISSVKPTIVYQVNDGEWSSTKPTATNPGFYKVSYKIAGTDNYNGTDAAVLGTVELKGTKLVAGTDYTAPKEIADLAFRWDNSTNKAIDQALITAGSIDASKGTMYYASKLSTATDFSAWSTTVPTASQAGVYNIKWKIVGANGSADVAETSLSDVTIATVQPTVTAATGATLTYTGADQNLLAENKGSATFGATSALMYKVNYSATQLDENGIALIDWDKETAVAEANVKDKTAGYFYIQTLVPAGGNYQAAKATKIAEAVIAKPSLFTAVPEANDLTWDNTDQQLIKATAKEDNKAKYLVSDTEVKSFKGVTWTTDIASVTRKAAGTYFVYYMVDDANYAAVDPTLIPNTKIKKKVLSVKVNDVTKVYDATVDLKALTTADYSLMGLVGDGTGATAPGKFAYADIEDATAKNAGEYAGVVKVKVTSGANDNYEYNIIPGNLTVTQRELTVIANNPITTDYGVAKNISREYTVSGIVYSENDGIEDDPSRPWIKGAFSVAPELTSNATGTTPAIGKYTLSFTKGTLKENGNYKMSTKGDGGYDLNGSVFEVKANADTKIIITVLPHTQEYTGVAESWANIEEGTDYVVSGLMTGDALATAPTFKRANDDKFDADTYALTASGATIADDIKAKYPGGIVYNGSTFTITKKEVKATITQQTVKVGAVALPDPDAWSVTGLTDADAATGKSILEGVLSINGSTAKAKLLENGIKLTINDKNYTFKDADGNEVKFAYGNLNVIDPDATLFLDDSKADNLEKIAAKDGKKVNVQIQFNRDQELGGARTWEAGQWNTMVLPFEISVAELSKCLTYAIVNVINPERTVVSGTGSKFYGKLTMTGGNGKDDVLAANKPFLVKTAQDIPNETIIDFGSQTIVAPTVGGTVVDAGGDCKFVGTYEKKTVTKDDDAAIWFMLGNDAEWAYIKADSPNKWDIVPFAAYIDMSAVPAGARNFTFYAEELDGSTTAIKSISTDNNGSKLSGEGWYNLNGTKLNGAPTKKGIYIQNGKKVIVK